MPITFTIDECGIAKEYDLPMSKIVNILFKGAKVLINDSSRLERPELLEVYSSDGEFKLGEVPDDLSGEIREITSNFDELEATIERVERTPGSRFKLEINLYDFIWDTSVGYSVLVLKTDNSEILPAEGTFEYNIYKQMKELKKLREEGEQLEMLYRKINRRW